MHSIFMPASRVRCSLTVLCLAWLAVASAHAFDPRPGGPAAESGTRIHAASGTVEVLFTPWDDAEGAILRAMQGARKVIYVQAFLFTSRTLARALIEAKMRGIAVEVMVDREQTERGENSQVPQLAAAGIPVALEVRYAAAHNKIILVDPADAAGAVVTGSYNYTYSAQARNAENVVILRGNPAVASAYLANWKRHRAGAVSYERSKSPPDAETPPPAY